MVKILIKVNQQNIIYRHDYVTTSTWNYLITCVPEKVNIL